jgi:hypothetical protein
VSPERTKSELRRLLRSGPNIPATSEGDAMPTIPADLDRLVDHQDQRERLRPTLPEPATSREDTPMPMPTAEAFTEAAAIADGADRLAAMVDEDLERSVTDAAMKEDTARILQLLDQQPTDRATLSMPLGRLVDADGTETVLGYALVHITLTPGVLVAQIAGEDPALRLSPFAWQVEREFTPDGEAAIRALAALLPQDGQR